MENSTKTKKISKRIEIRLNTLNIYFYSTYLNIINNVFREI